MNVSLRQFGETMQTLWQYLRYGARMLLRRGKK